MCKEVLKVIISSDHEENVCSTFITKGITTDDERVDRSQRSRQVELVLV